MTFRSNTIPIKVILDDASFLREAAKVQVHAEEAATAERSLTQAARGLQVAHKDANATLRQFDRLLAKQATATPKKVRISFTSMANSANEVGDALKRVTQNFQQAFDVAGQSARFEDSLRIFEKGGLALADFRKETQGMISDVKLVQGLNLARTMGIDAKSFIKLAKIAEGSARATGQSYRQMLNSIVLGTARQSRLLLDNLGIILSQEKAVNAYAAAHHKLAGDLSASEKKQAFFDEVIRQGSQNMIDMEAAGATAGRTFDQFQAATENLTVAIGKALGPAMQGAIPILEDFVRLMEKAVGKDTRTAAEKFADNLQPVSQTIASLKADMEQFKLSSDSFIPGQKLGIAGMQLKQTFTIANQQVQLTYAEAQRKLKHFEELKKKLIEEFNKTQEKLKSEATKPPDDVDKKGLREARKAAQQRLVLLRDLNRRKRALRKAEEVAQSDSLINEIHQQQRAVDQKIAALMRFANVRREVSRQSKFDLDADLNDRARAEERLRKNTIAWWNRSKRRMAQIAREEERRIKAEERARIAAARRLAREQERLRKARERAERKAHEEFLAREREKAQQIVGFMNIGIQATEGYIDALINNDRKAMVAVTQGFLRGTGQQLIAIGTKGIAEGLVMNAVAPGTGLPAMGTGAAIIGAGIAMGGAAGAVPKLAQAIGFIPGESSGPGAAPGVNVSHGKSNFTRSSDTTVSHTFVFNGPVVGDHVAGPRMISRMLQSVELNTVESTP